MLIQNSLQKFELSVNLNGKREVVLWVVLGVIYNWIWLAVKGGGSLELDLLEHEGSGGGYGTGVGA